MKRKLVSIVVPVLNEAGSLDAVAARVANVMQDTGFDWELLFVDDGSSDDTMDRLRAMHQSNPDVKALSLSRNFGKEIAIAAGLHAANGDAAILMDADLQHPPEVIPAFLDKWREGFDIVYGERRDRTTDTTLRRILSKLYYTTFNILSRGDIPPGAGDFRLLDRRAIDALNRIGEVSRFNKGLFSWIGFRSAAVPYSAKLRHTGRSRWNLRRLIHFAIDGITSFSTLPLRIWSLLGLLISITAFLYALTILLETLIYGTKVPGFPSLIISVMLLSGVQLISLGVIGEYIGRIYEEVKRRPLYLVAEEVGMDVSEHPGKAADNLPPEAKR